MKFGKISGLLNKNSSKTKEPLLFQSLLNGDSITLDVCSFEEVLPYPLSSIPIPTITTNDNVWIAASMLSRISDTTNNLVVVEDGFPIGTIDVRRIISGLEKNPTSSYFEEGVSKIMDPDFYIDSRNVNISTMLRRMNKAGNFFTIIENDKYSFSQFSIRQILEVASLCRSGMTSTEMPKRRISTFNREDRIKDIIRKLGEDRTGLLALKDDVTFISYEVLLEKLKELNTPQNNKIHDLSASTLKTITPTLISEKLTIAEICKIMLNQKYPYVMTSEQLITPQDIVESICKGL